MVQRSSPDDPLRVISTQDQHGRKLESIAVHQAPRPVQPTKDEDNQPRMFMDDITTEDGDKDIPNKLGRTRALHPARTPKPRALSADPLPLPSNRSGRY